MSWIRGFGLRAASCRLPLLLIGLQWLLFPRVACAEQPPAAAANPPGALKAYVAKEDKSYHWSKRHEGPFGQGSYVELALVSQTWQNIVWKHQLFIYKPSKLAAGSQALLMIEGGRTPTDWDKPAADLAVKPPPDAAGMAALAEQLQSPVAVLLQVPEQPIFNGLVEDQAISFTFAQYFLTHNAESPLLLPMVKSAVRGMDAVQECCRQDWSLEVKHFIVTGASKRGWTTWLTAAVDPRVNGLAPMVIDMLNMGPQMKNQVASFGKASERLHDYTDKGLQMFLDTDTGRELTAIVDPYSYRQAITQPKLIFLGTNDPYWPLDSLNLYWDGLSGEKYVCYVPNKGHGLGDPGRIGGGLAALHREVTGGKPLPKLSFQYAEHDGQVTLKVQSDMRPREVRVWTAAATTHDFRKSHWDSRPAEADGAAYRCDLPIPASGCAALFGEATFDGEGIPFYLLNEREDRRGKMTRCIKPTFISPT